MRINFIYYIYMYVSFLKLFNWLVKNEEKHFQFLIRQFKRFEGSYFLKISLHCTIYQLYNLTAIF